MRSKKFTLTVCGSAALACLGVIAILTSERALAEDAAKAGPDEVRLKVAQLETRIADLEERARGVVPIGSVIDWYPRSKDTPIPDGYALCDGKPVHDSKSVFDAQSTPDLSGLFVMGVSAEHLGERGGRADIPKAGDHHHTGRTAGPSIGGFDHDHAFQAYDGNHLQNHTHSFTTSNAGEHDHGGENRPPFIGLLKLIRIR